MLAETILSVIARFVLIHGAWHGGWCFERLTAELVGRGHQVSAPDLPCDEPGLSVHDYAAVVGHQPDDVVVGHSLAGLTLPFVPARVSVFLAALVPMPDVYASFTHPDFTGMVRDELDRSYWPDEATARTRMHPDLDSDMAAWAFARLRRQARLEPVLRLPDWPSAYILARRDRVVSPAWQATTAREVLGVEPIEIDSGHSLMITHPSELADVLESLA